MAQTDFLEQMGSRIALRRKALRMTQEELAETIGVSTQMVSNLELGKKAVRPENLARVCAALGLSADYVLTGAPQEANDLSAL
ncbi:MAG: helix-turn-helix transcriptional regulator, partial [Clostridia bacterium]|nr:helix-turn-helix transcriptional regulator [Clostridia bacterium]